MEKIENKILDEERALYSLKDAEVSGCKFDGPADGESALKECENISVSDCYFNLRYPFWHNDNAEIQKCEMTENCRAALWYCENVKIENTLMHGIKALRECHGITLENVHVKSTEYLWRCSGINIKDSEIEFSEYPFFECQDITINNLKMTGKYSFQYVENAVIKNSVLNTKDAFWHSKNITVTDSEVNGEYLGWYSENLRLIRCKITGTQPLCYCKGLVLEDCEMVGCDLSFERSGTTATIKGNIDSIKNPAPGSCITADCIGEIILENEFCEPSKIKINVNE